MTDHTYAMIDRRTRELFVYDFRKRKLRGDLLNCAYVLRLVIKNIQTKAKMECEITMLKALDANLHFQGAAIMSRESSKKKLNR